MQYTSSLPFRGDVERAFGLAEVALTALGFQLAQRTDALLEMHGPGMNSSRESPLMGATRIAILRRNGELVLESQLGGVERMSRFVRVFPIGLTLCLGLALVTAFLIAFGVGPWIGVAAAAIGGNALLWLVLGPIMAGGMRKRTCRGLDMLLGNMVNVGES